MHHLATVFAAFCESSFDLEHRVIYDYHSLTVCIIDCVYSLRARYETVTLPVVQRYADHCMNGDPNAAGDTLSSFLARVDAIGENAFAQEILRNRQLTGGRPKIAVCRQLAHYLQLLHIDTLDDFRNYEAPELLEAVIRAVKGIGSAGTHYLFILTGDENRCKPDVHIHCCIRDACDHDLPDDECQQLFTDTIALLHARHPALTCRDLDAIIWSAYAGGHQA